jgi:hypothetical protein
MRNYILSLSANEVNIPGELRSQLTLVYSQILQKNRKSIRYYKNSNKVESVELKNKEIGVKTLENKLENSFEKSENTESEDISKIISPKGVDLNKKELNEITKTNNFNELKKTPSKEYSIFEPLKDESEKNLFKQSSNEVDFNKKEFIELIEKNKIEELQIKSEIKQGKINEIINNEKNNEIIKNKDFNLKSENRISDLEKLK